LFTTTALIMFLFVICRVEQRSAFKCKIYDWPIRVKICTLFVLFLIEKPEAWNDSFSICKVNLAKDTKTLYKWVNVGNKLGLTQAVWAAFCHLNSLLLLFNCKWLINIVLSLTGIWCSSRIISLQRTRFRSQPLTLTFTELWMFLHLNL